MVDISVVLDSFDDPFGAHRIRDRSGHSKPTHLHSASATVQEKGAVLSLMDVTPGLGQEPQASLATNVLFPMNAEEVLVDGKPLTLAAGKSVPTSLDSWVIVRSGGAGRCGFLRPIVWGKARVMGRG